MALGFLKKVFSFGRKEVEERPAEDAPLAPLNFEALKEFAAEAPTPPSPLRGGSVGEADRGGVADEVRDSTVSLAPGVEEKTPSTAETTPSGPSDHLPLKGGEEPTPAESEVPAPAPEPIPAPEPEPEKPAPEVEPTPSPEPEPAPPEIPDEPARPEPARQPAPEIPQPAEPTQPEPVEVPLPAPVEVPGPVETPAPPTLGAAPSSRLRGSEGRARPVARPEVGEAGRGGVADESRDSLSPAARDVKETPSTAATTPSGPSGALRTPLKEGEEQAPVPAFAPSPVRVESSASPPPGKVTVGKAVEKKAEAAPVPAAPEPRKSWFQRLRDGLSRSSRELTGSIAGIFTKRKLDEDTLEELEDVLIRADLGMETALRVTDTLASSRYGKDVSDTEVRTIMAQEVEKVLTPVAKALELDLSHKPHVILVVGVNGTGKTTTIGKLAAKLRQGGLSVMLAAGDTFRAAAIEQLKIWGERTGSPVVSSKLGADAAGLAWDAFEKAKEAGSDVLIIDTAGRLQNRTELMAELEKIVRVLGKHDPEAPHTVLQTVDATTGQNALNQVEIFRNVAGVNGLVMTKLDGTARGGILVAIAAKHKLPVYFIGVGEQVDDLEPFSASDFAKAIAGVG
ncbi:signal recognition particle-docking protein FtsY [Mesorhizobium sp. IMUNJ 23232]|uniref:signal recognition particle-docking protein FtsY n=1 Tax=Mesorhizobium sp. IMUNJ 23232 TaxID=3376064 RepID=UPI003793C979